MRAHVRDLPWRPLDLSVRTEPTSPESWTQAWRPPFPPHHLLGDPLTRRKKASYVNQAAEEAERLRG